MICSRSSTSGGGGDAATAAVRRREREYDAWLSKAIQRVVLASVFFHVIALIQSSSKSTGDWLDSLSKAQYLQDLPTVSADSWGVLSGSTGMNSMSESTNFNSSVGESNASTQQQQDISNSNATAPTYDIRAPPQANKIPLEELMHYSPNETCNPGKSKKRLVRITHLPENITYSTSRKIPKIIHVTSKTRCMTPPFLRNLDKWRFDGYSFYFHDDAAMERLLSKYWPEFPHLQLLQECMISGASKADLWRLLVLWEYGGIYTDIDNAPGPKFENGAVIRDDDEAWFVVERAGYLSQYFMAAEPRHPLIYTSILVTLEQLLGVANIQSQYVPKVTGPNVLKIGMMKFRKVSDKPEVKEGVYRDAGDKTVTVAGRKGHGQEYIIRESVHGIHKKGGYFAMGMKHFSEGSKTATTQSCYEYLHEVAKRKSRGQEVLGVNGVDTPIS